MGAITFLMGSDPSSANPFFGEARKFFTALQSEIVDAPTGGQTLEGVVKVLADRAKLNPAKIYNPINIVSHATGFSSLEFKLRATSADIITESVLTAEVIKLNATPRPGDVFPQLAPPVITPDTKVVLYGCDVGRATGFLTNLGRMFAEALHIYAPLRVAVFRHVNNTSEYRLARTWAVNFTSNIQRTTTAQWAAVRVKFRDLAETKFDPKWTASVSPLSGVRQMIEPIANASTAAMANSWFFSETMSFTVPAGTTEAAARAMVSTTKSAILPASPDVDDTTVESVVTPSDYASTDGRNYVAWIAVLAEIIDKPVDISDTAQYGHVQILPPKAQSPGPKAPTGSTTTSSTTPGAETPVDARDTLVAAGVEEAAVDELFESQPSEQAPLLGGPDGTLAIGDDGYSEGLRGPMA